MTTSLAKAFGTVRNLACCTRNISEIGRIMARETPVFFVTSYPRSGNTWLRYLLTDIFHQRMGIKTNTILPVHPDQVIPDIYCHSIPNRSRDIHLPGLFVKTHEPYDRLKIPFSAASFAKSRHLYIFRSPEDCLVSLYHYHHHEDNRKTQTALGIDALCRTYFAQWEASISSYLRAREKGVDVWFVSYEMLFTQTADALGGMLNWIGVSYTREMIDRAISNMNFGNLRALEEAVPSSQKEFFFRRGSPGGGREELRHHTLAEIRQEAMALLQKANVVMERQYADMAIRNSHFPSVAAKASTNDVPAALANPHGA